MGRLSGLGIEKNLTVCGMCNLVEGCPLKSVGLNCEDAIKMCTTCEYNDILGECRVAKVKPLKPSNCKLMRKRMQEQKKESVRKLNKDLEIMFDMDEEFEAITCGMCKSKRVCPINQQEGAGVTATDDCEYFRITFCVPCENYGMNPITHSNICALDLNNNSIHKCPIEDKLASDMGKKKRRK